MSARFFAHLRGVAYRAHKALNRFLGWALAVWLVSPHGALAQVPAQTPDASVPADEESSGEGSPDQDASIADSSRSPEPSPPQSPAQPSAAEPSAAEPSAAEPSAAQPSPPVLIGSSTVLWPEGVPAPPAAEVLLTVDSQGMPTDIELQTAGLPDAGGAAVLAAARELRFEPARGPTGEALAARIRFRFALEAPEPAVPPEASTPAAATAAPQSAEEKRSPPGAQVGRSSSPASEPALPVLEAPTFGARAQVDPPDPGAATQIQLRAEELTVVPGTFGEPLRVVATLPGVARTPFGLGFFAVRGASLQNTGFLVDGFPVPLLYHLGAGPAVLSSRLVDGLDFYPGGYPLAYGRFSAGLISLSTQPPQTDGPLLELQVDLLKAGALGVLPFDGGRGRVAVAYRRSYYELILPLITDDVSLSYSDYQVRLDYRFSERVAASLFVFGSRDSLQFSQEIGAGRTVGQVGGGLSYTFDRVVASVRLRASDTLKLAWAGTAGPSAIDFGRESTGDASLGVDTASLRLGQRMVAVYTPAPVAQTTLGVEQNVWINRLTGQAPSFGELPYVPAPGMTRESIEVVDRLAELTVAPYLEQILRPGPLVVTGGLRLEHYRYGEMATWVAEPRAVVKLLATDGLTLKAASGLFSQAPLPFQYNRSFGNPRLLPNRSWQNSFGLEAKLPLGIDFETTVFWNQMWQLTRGSGRPTRDEQGNPVLLIFEDDGKGRSYGWEVLLRRKIERGLFGWLSYTLSRSERFLDGGAKLPFFFDQTHVLNLAASYQLGRFRFGLRFALATGRPSLELRRAGDGSNVVYDADEDDANIEFGQRRVRQPTFHQLDARIDYEFYIGPVEASVFLDIINVYSAQNSEGYTYEYDFSERGRVPGLPFLPTIGIRGVLQ